MKKKLIIFDLDGVLVDSTKLVNDYMIETYPTLTKSALQEMLSGNFREGLEKIKLAHRPKDETPEEKETRKAAYTVKKSESLLYDGIFELIKRLHDAGYILAINTSALLVNSLPVLEKAGISKLFDIVAAAEMSTSKVEKFRILEEKYKLPREDILFITDTLGDVREADIAGIPTIAVTYGAHDRSYFTREPHKNLITIVDTVEELGKVVKDY